VALRGHCRDVGLFVYGIITCTTGINSYLLDAYPEGSGEIVAWINLGRMAGGFITYYEILWTTAMGTRNALGILASIVAMAFGLIAILQFFGKSLREFLGGVHVISDGVNYCSGDFMKPLLWIVGLDMFR
jgi:hypothetical protein